MKQHTIQKSLIKNFALGGKVKCVRKYDLSEVVKTPKESAYFDDFQSSENEKLDQLIEVGAIREIHKLRKGTITKLDTADVIDYWVAIHMARTPRELSYFRDAKIPYDRGREVLIEHCIEEVKTFPHLWTLTRGEEQEYLVLPDHPVTRFADEALLFPLSPSVLLAYTKNNPQNYEIEGRTIFEAFNELLFGFAQEFVYCHLVKHPNFRELRARYELRVAATSVKSPLAIPKG